ncbi:hypothetical protein HQ587_08935 [bacterium]|nr:hypothetical protein [bacterium]
MKSKKEILNEEIELLKQFKERIPGAFWEDGIVNPDVYLNHKNYPRILYIMKEANAEGESDDLRKFLRGKSQGQTWNTVARWNYAIFNNFPSWNEIIAINEVELRKKWLSYCSVVNLKKSPGGGSADIDSIQKAADKCKDLLVQQILLYEPHFMICCGTGYIVSQLFQDQILAPWKKSRFGLDFAEFNLTSCFTIQYIHPQARFSNNFKHFMLTETIKELIKETKP